MTNNARIQVIVVLTAGVLLGYLAASGNISLGRQVAAAAASQAGQQEAVIVITIRLPADAILEIDGHRTTETGETRTFQTPPLALGSRYTYNPGFPRWLGRFGMAFAPFPRKNPALPTTSC
jgi:hypothetical protein